MAPRERGGGGGEGAQAVYLFIFLGSIRPLSIAIDYSPGESSVTVTGLPWSQHVASCRLRNCVSTFHGPARRCCFPGLRGFFGHTCSPAVALTVQVHVGNCRTQRLVGEVGPTCRGVLARGYLNSFKPGGPV